MVLSEILCEYDGKDSLKAGVQSTAQCSKNSLTMLVLTGSLQLYLLLSKLVIRIEE